MPLLFNLLQAIEPPKKPDWFKKCVYTGEEGLLENLNALIRQGIKGV